MTPTETVNATGTPAEPSIQDLRTMLSTPAPEPEAESRPATGEPEKIAPAEGTGDSQEAKVESQPERGERGQFKAKVEIPADLQPAVDEIVSKRVGKEVKKRTEAETKARELEIQLDTLRKGNSETPKPAPVTSEPKLQDYTGNTAKYETFEDAIQAFMTDRDQYRDRARTEQQRGEQTQRQWSERQAEATKSIADYKEVVESVDLPNTPATQAFAAAVLESEMGPQVMYYLGKNPQEVERLAALSPLSAVRELGKIENKLSTPPLAPTRVAAKPLPKPPAVVGGDQGPVQVDLEKADMRTFRREMGKLLTR